MSVEIPHVPETDLTLTSLIDSIIGLTLRGRVKEFIRELPEPDIEQGILTDIKRVNEALAPCILTIEEQNFLLTTRLKRGETPWTKGEKIRMLITSHQDHLLKNTLRAVAALNYLRTEGGQQIEVLRHRKPTVVDLDETDIPLFCLAMALNLFKGNLDDPHGRGDPRDRVPQGTTTSEGRRRTLQVIKIY